MPWLALKAEISEMFDTRPEREYREAVYFSYLEQAERSQKQDWYRLNRERVIKRQSARQTRLKALQPPRICKHCPTVVQRPKRLCDTCRDGARAREQVRQREWYQANRETVLTKQHAAYQRRKVSK